MLYVGVTWGFWFQFTSSFPGIKFYLAIYWHKPLILAWLMPLSQWSGMGALSKRRLTGSIMIRTFSRCEFGILLQELFCFLLWFYSFIYFLLEPFTKMNLLFILKTMSFSFRRHFTLRLSLNKAVNTLCLLKYDPLLWHCPTRITHCSTNSNSILRSMTPSLSFLRWSICSQRRPSSPIMFVKFFSALNSDLFEKVSTFFRAYDKISSK